MSQSLRGLTSIVTIPRVLALLSAYPDGLPVKTVADQLGLDPERLRGDILRFYAADFGGDSMLGLGRPEVIEFLSASGVEADPGSAAIIRVVAEKPAAELGVEYIPAEKLAELYAAAVGLAATEPDNGDLAVAIETLASQFLVGLDRDTGPVQSHTGQGADATPAVLRQALEDRQSVRIRYSRAWRPGVGERVVHPYALHHTHRGWELDAGPLVDGHVRSFIVSRIRDVEVLSEPFERPDGVDEAIAADRRARVVELNLPQGTEWVIDRFAERVEVVDSDREDIHVRAEFLPPFWERVGLALAIAGPGAFVIEPRDLADSGVTMARRLLRHHGLD